MLVIKRKIFNLIRKLRRIDVSNWYRGNLHLISGGDLNSHISELLLNKTPFVVARLGSVEIKPIIYYNILQKSTSNIINRLYLKGDIDFIYDRKQYLHYMMSMLYNNAGFFPKDIKMMEKFAALYIKILKDIDILCVWLNEYLLKDFYSEKTLFSELGSLEPYDYTTPWSKYLKGKKVLVISPFAQSIKSQYNRRNKIWANKDILPDFDLVTITAVQSIAGTICGFDNWFDALDSMKNQMNEIDYDIALIGCGAYGLPLATHAKSMGKQAIHLGGPLQILFGIKGKRWDDMPEVNKFYNEFWVYPSADETPKHNKKVEDGCYW